MSRKRKDRSGWMDYADRVLRENSQSRQVMNPPAQAEAGNLANTAPLPADHEAQRRGFDKRVVVAGGRQPVTATADLDEDREYPQE